MSVITTNLVEGPGTLYTGDFGATEPLDTAVATAPSNTDWTDVGATQDGINLKISEEWTELEVDQIVDIPGRRRTKREFIIETNLAEATLDNLALALNGGTIASGGTTSTAYRSLTPDFASSATQPTYKAFILDGFAPEGNARRVIGRKMLSVEGTEFAYAKKDMAVFKVSLSGHYVSSAIPPFKIVDAEPTA